MDFVLSDIEARVLGSLMEKESTTPEYYPLSLNALVNACNQKNNREPVMALGENEVRDALQGLELHRLAGQARTDSRVAKFEHHLQEVFNFTRGESALICTLLLRGAQTPGELRSRSERMHSFAELEDVHSALRKLMQREPALVKVLPQQTGTREARYAHLFSGDHGSDNISTTSESRNSPLFVLLCCEPPRDTFSREGTISIIKVFRSLEAAESEAEHLRLTADVSKREYVVHPVV